jgi:hypothetical protein
MSLQRRIDDIYLSLTACASQLPSLLPTAGCDDR